MAGKAVIQMEIDVQSKNAESKINKLQAGLGTLSGLKAEIRADVVGGDAAANRIDELITKFQGLRKVAGEKVNIASLLDIQNLGPAIEEALKTATGKAKTQLLELRDMRNELLRGWQGRVDKVIANRSVSGTVNKRQALSRSANENRDLKIRDIDQNLAIARQTGNLRQQISLLARKRDLLQAINRSNRNNAHDAEIAQINQEILALQKKKEAIRGNTKALGEQSRVFGALKSLATRYLSIYAVANLGRKIAETTGYFQQQQVALEGILGSASKAQSVLNEIKSFAVQSPFQTKELVTFTKQLAAFGVGNNDLFPTVKKLADISAGLGVDMNRIILAYGQVKSAAVLRGQELRQFTEAGIPMVQALADKFTELNGRLVTTGEVFKLISERKVPFEMVASVLYDMTAEGGKFYKMQENITDTMYGQMQKLRDMWTIEMERIGKSGNGFFMGIIKLLQAIIKHGKTLTITFAAAFATSRIAKYITHFRGLIRLMRIAVATTGGWGAILTVTAGAIAGIWTSFAEGSKKVSKAMAEIDSSFNKETSKMISGFDKLVNKLQSLSTNFGSKAFNEALSALKANYGDYLNDEMIDALVNQKEGWDKIAESIRAAIKEVQNYNNALARSAKGADIVNEDLANEGWLGWFSGMKKILNDIRNNKKGLSFEDKGTIFENSVTGNAAIDYANMAIENLMANKGTTSIEFKEEIKQLYMEDENLRRVLLLVAKDIFDKVQQMEGWQKYEENLKQANNSPLNIIKKNFDKTLKKANKEFEGLWNNLTNEDKESKDYTEPSELGKQYNPIAWNKGKQEDLAKTAFETAQQFLFNDSAARIALEAKWAELNMPGKETSDRVLGIADALEDLSNTIGDGVLQERISMLRREFSDVAQINTGESKQVNERIEDRIGKSSEAQYKDFFMRYMASDATYKQMVAKVIEDRDEHQKYLDTHKRDTGAHAVEYDRIKEEKKWLDDIFSNVYALKDKDKNGGAGTEQDVEISEFISRLKDAYEVYKKATQAEGADMGLAYMQGDSKMIERFANFFNGGKGKNGFDIFQNENGEDIKIGKSGQTIRQLLEDTFINGGIENGVIDFEKAIRKVGEAMIEYGKQNEKARKGFISAGKAYIKYADQISKDNVAAWIAEMNKQFADLGKTFERTSQQVELYRGLMRNGTSGQLGQYAGVGKGAAMVPDSVRNAGNIKQMVELYNKLLREEASKNLKAGETLDESKLNYLSIDKLGSVADIQKAIAMVTERTKLNNDNFGLGAFGEAGSRLETMLQNQLNIIIKELQSISSEQYTGDSLADAIANAQNRVKTAIDITRSQEMVNKLYGGDHGAAMKGRMDATFAAMQSIFDEFLKSNNFEAMSQATRFFTNKDGSQSSTEIWGAAGIDIKALKEKFKKIVDSVDDNILKDELQLKFRDLELKVLEFNAAGGDLGAIHDNIQLYKGAHQEAVDRYESYKAKQTVLGNQIEAGGYANAQGQFVQFSDEQLQRMKEELAACNEELVKMGENGINFEKSLKGAALKNIQASIGKASQGLNAMQDAVMGVINAASSLAKAVNKVYDVMNDGENPAWMQDMEGFLEDFGEAFQMLIAPIAAVIAMIMALAIVSVTAESMMTPLLIIMLAIIAAALIVAAIIAACQQHDRALQREIENLEKQIEDTQNAIKNLEAASKRMNGFRKLNAEIQALSKNWDIYRDKLRQAQLEEEKKNTDNDKVKEYKQGAQEALDEFLNSLQDATDEITGSVQDWASSLSEALRSAFQNGENAARSFRNTAIEMVGDIVNKIIEMTVLEPMIENAIKGLLGYSLDKNSADYIGNQDRFKNADGSINSQKLADWVTDKLSNDNAEGIYQFLKAVEGGYGRVIDFINNDLAKPLKEAWAFNSDTSTLSGGIQGITEDTARTLEGLANSQLAQLVLIQRSVLALEGSGFAQVQTSWFNDMLNHQRAIRIATEGVNKALEDMRNGLRPLNVAIAN